MEFYTNDMSYVCTTRNMLPKYNVSYSSHKELQFNKIE